MPATRQSLLQNGCKKVVSCYSKALKEHEQVYCTTCKELIAVVCAQKHIHLYLYGLPVLLRTDNAAVNWMRNLKNPSGQDEGARYLSDSGPSAKE